MFESIGHKEPRLAIPWLFTTRSCEGKVRYMVYEDAIRAAERLEYEYLITEMSAYRCMTHRCWHVAHKEDFLRTKRRRLLNDFNHICDVLLPVTGKKYPSSHDKQSHR